MKQALISKPDGISVVVCTYNGKERLTATLTSIFNQKTNNTFKWEVLLIDNASTDGTKEFCIDLSIKIKNKFNHSFRIINESNLGLNNARKKGLTESTYNWVLFCDDDNHLFDNYLQTGFDIISKHSSFGALGGMGLPLFEIQKPEWFDEYAHSFAVGRQNSSNGKITYGNPEVYGAGCYYYKPILQKIFATGYHTIMSDRKGKSLSSGGDIEWCYLLQIMNYEIWFSDELKFYHLMPATRLTWDYYIKLKKGIANGRALLFSYIFYLKKENTHPLFFLYNYFQYWAITCMVYLRLLLKINLKVKNKKDKKIILALNILKATAISFTKNLYASYQHYKQIMQLVKNLN